MNKKEFDFYKYMLGDVGAERREDGLLDGCYNAMTFRDGLYIIPGIVKTKSLLIFKAINESSDKDKREYYAQKIVEKGLAETYLEDVEVPIARLTLRVKFYEERQNKESQEYE